MTLMNKILVMGSGSWGTALVKILLEDPNMHVDWWVRSADMAAAINTNGRNPKYLRSVKFDLKRLHVSTHAEELIDQNDHILLVTPSAFVFDLLDPIDAAKFKDKTVISAIKGVIPHTKQIIADYLINVKGVKTKNFLVITGPCHAEEVAQEKLSYLTVASKSRKQREKIAEALSCSFIRVTQTDDIYGTEITAVLKNVYAIAAGMCHSLGYGDNFQAVLMSNAIREIKKFIKAYYPIKRDTNKSAYLGDLLVTGYSQYSRNRTLGAMLGKGYSTKSALMEMQMIAEGYYAADSIHQLNEELGVSMPILDFVYVVIYENKNVKEEAIKLTTLLN